MSHKHDSSKKESSNFIEELENEIIATSEEDVKNQLYKFECPKCKKEFDVIIGLNSCPHCNYKIDVEL